MFMTCSKPDRLSLEEDSNSYKTNFDLCFICQEATGEDLVETPVLLQDVRISRFLMLLTT